MADFEVKLNAQWGSGCISAYIPHTSAPSLTIKKPFPEPKELMEHLMRYVTFCKVKIPALKDAEISINEQTLKQRYYQLRRFATSAHAKGGNYHGRHICSVFEDIPDEQEHRGGSGLGEYEQKPKEPKERIPDRVTHITGWKGWRVQASYGGATVLVSNQNFIWTPGMASEAVCNTHNCKTPPCLACGCGLYAARETEPDLAKGYAHGQDFVFGKIALWGRYFLGTRGIRAQYGYPLEFHLRSDQGDLVDKLAHYGVPMFGEVVRVETVQLYTPEEPWKLERLKKQG
jgi:hypothetical protein